VGRILLKEVTKDFGSVNVIRPLNLEIGEGEFVVFVGPSGCGKSTLLRLIAGLENVTDGTIEINKQDATDMPPGKRGLAMVFQSYALYPHLTVAQNIAFPLRMAGLGRKEQRKRIDSAAAVLNLTDYLDRRPKQLSGGQRQRVAIGRAIVREPSAFLFDEPLSNLDAALRVGMRQEISELHKRLKTTMIYVTHDQVEAMTMADKIVVLNDGVIEQVGSPLELYDYPNNLFVAQFIGSPMMNIIEGIEADKAGASFLGVRPEHISLTSDSGQWSGTVIMSEHLGSDTFVRVDVDGIAETLTIRAFPHYQSVILSGSGGIMRKPDHRSNILLFLFDSLGTDDYAALAEKLPSINALRESSVWFSKAYCGCPESAPARASLFTGLDMAAHGVWTDGVTLAEHETIVTERFMQSGYQSWLCGRRQLAGVANWTTEHTRAGEYSHIEWAHGPLHRSRQNAYLAWLQANASSSYDDIFPTQANPDDTDIPNWQREAMANLPDELSFNAWIGANLVERITQYAHDQPFFAVAGFVVGESMGAEQPKNRVAESLNQRALRHADSAVGSVLQTLQSEGMTDNTIVVVAAARGSVSAKEHDQDLHEHAIKVPLLIRAPGHVPRCVDSAVSTMDLVPTLYQLASVVAPQRIQGRSLLTEEPRQWSVSRLRNPGQQHQTALCTERFKLIVTHAKTAGSESASYRLYDMRQDPDELHDLASIDAHQDLLESMIDQLIDARVALEDRTEPRIADF